MKLTEFTQRHERLLAWFFICAALLALHFWAQITQFQADAGYYWNLSEPSTFLHFSETYRGYAYALILLPIHAIANLIGKDDHIAFRIIGSVTCAYLLTSPIAELMHRAFGGKLSYLRRIAFSLIVIAVFPGLFVYPLSDFPSEALFLVALYLSGSASGKLRLLKLFFAGAAAYAAYNTRTIFLFAFPLLLITTYFAFLRDLDVKGKTLGTALFLAGAVTVSIPQMIINANAGLGPSPMVSAKVPDGRSIMTAQLYWGITTQKYETFLAPNGNAEPRIYRDPAGLVLNDRLRSENPGRSVTDYIAIVAMNPVQFAGIYTRHAFNGMDVRDGMVYTTMESGKKNGVSLLCFTLVFFSLLMTTYRKIDWIRGGPYAALILAPVLAILPGTIETRFFLPVFVLLAGSIATRFDKEVLIAVMRRWWIPVGVAFVLIFAVSTAITSETYSNVSVLSR